MWVLVLVSLLALAPAQERSLAREAGGAILGEVFTPPEDAQRQELKGGNVAYIWYNERGFLFNVKVGPDGKPYEIEQLIVNMPLEPAVNIRNSINSQYSAWLKDSSDDGDYFKDVLNDGYTIWHVSYGDFGQFKNVMRFWMKDLVAQSAASGETTSTGVNLDALFSMYGANFPNGLGGINIGVEFEPGEVWTLAGTEFGLKTYEYIYANDDVFTVVTDNQGVIINTSYTFYSQPEEFREELKQYLMNKYGKYLASTSESGFLKTVRFEGPVIDDKSDVLEMKSAGHVITIKSSRSEAKPEKTISEAPKTEAESYLAGLDLNIMFDAPADGLPYGLGPIKLDDEFVPGDVWEFIKEEEGLKYYYYREYDNQDFTEVRADSQSRILSVHHYFVNPSAALRTKVKNHLKSAFNRFLELNRTFGDGTIIYYHQPATGGGVATSLAVYEFPDEISIRVFRGEL